MGTNKIHNRMAVAVLAVICLITTGCWDSVYRGYGDRNKIFTATFEVTNNTDQDIIYRHTYYTFPRQIGNVKGRFVIECFIGCGKTEEVGLSYWRYRLFDADNPEYVFNQIYIGDIKEDSKIEIISASSGEVLATWTPGGESSNNSLYHYEKWSCIKEQYEDETNIYTVFKWSCTLHQADFQ